MIEKISIGGAQFGFDYGINNKDGTIPQTNLNKILDYAFSQGINSIDTAKSYGDSESKIGNYLKERSSMWCVTTKVSNLDTSIEDQLEDTKIKIGKIPDITLAHSLELWRENSFRNELNSLKKRGLIKKTGVSVYNKKEIINILNKPNDIDVIQLPVNILDTRLVKDDSLKLLYKQGIEIHARSVFLQGMFFLSNSIIKKKFGEAFAAIQFIKSIIKNQNLNLAEFSLLFVINLIPVSKVIIGIDSLKQLKSNIGSINRKIDSNIYQQALSLEFDNDNILNPSLWK